MAGSIFGLSLFLRHLKSNSTIIDILGTDANAIYSPTISALELLGPEKAFQLVSEVPSKYVVIAANFAVWVALIRGVLYCVEALNLPWLRTWKVDWKASAAVAIGAVTIAVWAAIAWYSDVARFSYYWRIPEGATKSEVRAILGPPQSRDGSRWMYEGSRGYIEIEFGNDGRIAKKGYSGH